METDIWNVIRLHLRLQCTFMTREGVRARKIGGGRGWEAVEEGQQVGVLKGQEVEEIGEIT